MPGSVVAHFAMPAILERFGDGWLQGGWYDFNFVSPVYVDEDVRTVAGGDGDTFACRVETRDGRLCAHGKAGTGANAPWQSEGAWRMSFPMQPSGRNSKRKSSSRVPMPSQCCGPATTSLRDGATTCRPSNSCRLLYT